jgi:hypothetical protein
MQGLPDKHEQIGGNVEPAEEDAWRDYELAELIFPDRTSRDVSLFRIPGRALTWLPLSVLPIAISVGDYSPTFVQR